MSKPQSGDWLRDKLRRHLFTSGAASGIERWPELANEADQRNMGTCNLDHNPPNKCISRPFENVCAIHTRYMVDDDSSMLLRQRFVASVRCRFW
jgi:hypothetical protein